MMTVFFDFIDELAHAIAVRREPIDLSELFDFVRLLCLIDRDARAGELRHEMEQIVTQGDVSFGDRCRMLLPLMRSYPM